MICMFKAIQYCYVMYLKIWECLEIYELDPARFPIARRFAWQAALKRTKVIRSLNWYWSYWKYKKVSGEEYVTLFINSSIYKS